MKKNSTGASRQQQCNRRQFLIGATGLLSVAAMPALLAQADRRYNIGIIGSGNMGGAVGTRWAEAGHQVLFSSRNPDQLQTLVEAAGSNARAGYPADAVAFGEVIFIAVPYGALPQIGDDYAAAMAGKIVIECGNPRADRDGPMADAAIAMGTGVASAEYLPGVRLVRALNAISFVEVNNEAHRAGELIGVPIAGDDAGAVAVATQLVSDCGFEPVVVGGLARAREFDRGTEVYVRGLTAQQLRAALHL
ncbi:MAG: NADP oxidoreductase [Gammaproteobacteria bacterium]|nr:NADP oxidoreductase [Gammaproteobacteria bacterium]